MRILHVVADCDPAKGGVTEGVLRLGEAYRELGHVQHLLTLDPPEEPWVRSCPSPVFAMGHRSANRLTWPGGAIGWLRRNVGTYDAVIVDGLWNAATLAARLALPGGKVPYGVFPHGMLDPWFRTAQPRKEWVKRQLFRVNEGPLLRSAQAVFFTAESERALAAGAWPGWRDMRECVVGFGTARPPAFDPAMRSAFGHAVPTLAANRYLLFLGRLHPKKGCEILLEAFAAATIDPVLQLVMAGPGEPAYVAQLKSRAAALGVAGRVHWPGMLSGAAKWGALHACDAMVLPSFQENFGVAVAEALGCGRPVVISDQVAIHDHVSASGAGVVATADAACTAQALRTIQALAPEEREAMGMRAAQLFRDRFDIRETAKQVIAAMAR
ncbi:glycosyltransferase [Parerythrobacter aurantius]|uniref:glycosyltransferase n=1 Tax=Parerythrobacter aurantius TaxID=3127706 RepID=UPI0032540AB8